MARSCLSQPIQPVRLHMESTPHVVTRTLFQSHLAIPEKPKCFIEKSQAQFSNLPNNQFPMETNLPSVIQQPASTSSGASAQDRHILPVPSWTQQLLKGEYPQSLSMENSSLKLFKINTGIIALHSPQTTFVLKWNSYLFSVWIFWWVFHSCSLLPKDWVFLYSRRFHAHNYMQVSMCNFYFI